MSAVPTFHPGHLVMVDIPGTSLDAATAEFLRRHHVRAICLFRRNLGTEDEIRKLTADLREVMGPNSLIGIDQEGGSTVRATFLPQVWESLPEPSIFLAELRRKARLPARFWHPDLRLSRYTVEKFL